MKDYFTLFGLEPGFDLDMAELERRYIEKQQHYHPDKFVMRAPQERIMALHMATDVNEAYEVLKDPLSRAEYLLELKGIHISGEEPEVKAAPETLMRAMEEREVLSEAVDSAAVMHLEKKTIANIENCIRRIAEALENHEVQAAAQLTLELKYLRKYMEEARLKRHQLQG
jgi:molecular chaperone HscB